MSMSLLAKTGHQLSVAVFLFVPSPRLTVIVVKKRVNARFFAQSGGRLQNPLPGTVIDVEVTRPEWYVLGPRDDQCELVCLPVPNTAFPGHLNSSANLV